MSGAGPSNPDKGKGREPAGGGGATGASNPDKEKGKQPSFGSSVAGPSNSDKGQKRAASPSGTSVSGSEGGWMSRGIKRHRVGPGPLRLPFGGGAPISATMRLTGGDGFLTGGGIKETSDGTWIPANAVEGSAPTQWVEQIPERVGALSGSIDERKGGIDFLQRAGHEALQSSPNGVVRFMLLAERNRYRLPRRELNRAQIFANAGEFTVPLSHQRREDDRLRRRAEARADREVEVTDQTEDEAPDDKVAKAMLVVYAPPPAVGTGSDKPPCENCGQATHETGHCHKPSAHWDTIVDSFCNVKADGKNHPLDSKSRFDQKGGLIGCAKMVEHYELNQWTDLFIHLVVYRIHKPPLRVRNSGFCWVRVLIKFADEHCGGEMPQQIVDGGGLLPYTKDDVATYRGQLETYANDGVVTLPRGILDGRSIAAIKEMVAEGELQPQIYTVKGRQHSESVRKEIISNEIPAPGQQELAVDPPGSEAAARVDPHLTTEEVDVDAFDSDQEMDEYVASRASLVVPGLANVRDVEDLIHHSDSHLQPKSL